MNGMDHIPAERITAALKQLLAGVANHEEGNERIFHCAGIRDFFADQEELLNIDHLVFDGGLYRDDRAAFGDFQTNPALALRVTHLLQFHAVNPEYIIEPTCGQGTFIVAALHSFNRIKRIFAVEIYKPYILTAKLDILRFALDHPLIAMPEISFLHANVFDVDFKGIAAECTGEVLILGNPPWVTNAMLGGLASSNLPVKSNFRNLVGLDAVMGKGNFDIGESVTTTLIESFQHVNGCLAFIVKNAVIRNVVFDQLKKRYRLGDLRKYRINSKKEFHVSVDASLLTVRLNAEADNSCSEFDLDDRVKVKGRFGWVGDKFVSSMEQYADTHNLDGISAFEWRQGVKHDCSSVMELKWINGRYVNRLGEEMELENEMVYGMLKSSSLKDAVVQSPQRFMIMTQKKVGQDTSFIQADFPKTFNYLLRHRERFEKRKSMIYRNKPAFSIFGVGEYSFKLYKVTISGLYKNYEFSLVMPHEGRPVMLDDTCYFLGFDTLEFAAYASTLLNSVPARTFLQSITFPDAKRTFTKDVLMRIDLLKLANFITEKQMAEKLELLNRSYHLNISMNSYHKFLRCLEVGQRNLGA